MQCWHQPCLMKTHKPGLHLQPHLWGCVRLHKSAMEVRRSHESPEVLNLTSSYGINAPHPHHQQYSSHSTSPYGLPSPPPGYEQGQGKSYAENSTIPLSHDKPKSKRKWWIVGGVVLVAIGAAIGGGVGGTLGNRSKPDPAARQVYLTSKLRSGSFDVLY
jgi:hypothetical protein